MLYYSYNEETLSRRLPNQLLCKACQCIFPRFRTIPKLNHMSIREVLQLPLQTYLQGASEPCSPKNLAVDGFIPEYEFDDFGSVWHTVCT